MKNTLILAVLLVLVNTITAQDTKTLSEKEVSVFIGPSFGNITSQNIESDKYASNRGSIWFNLGANFCKYANKNMGIVIGAEYSRYRNVATYEGVYRSTTKSVDPDNYIYYQQVETDYSETRTVHALEFPIALRLETVVTKNLEFYIDAGLKVSGILTATNKQMGTCNTKGAYPSSSFSNVFIIVENDPYYGYTNKTYSGSKDMNVKRIGFSLNLSTGLKANIQESTFLLINASYTQGFTDISDTKPDYVNIFGEKTSHTKFVLSQYTLRVGIGKKF